jgi:hypothetical protein
MLGTMIGLGVKTGLGMLKKKKTKRSQAGRGFVSGGTGPVLFEDRTLPPGGGVLSRPQPTAKAQIDLETGEITEKPRRRRRKRLLTCADRQDITFITATLGKGQMAQTAIASLLARCN